MATNPYNDMQVMMTLAALAGTAENRRLFETVAQQEQRILNTLNQELANPDIATAGQWQAIWVGLSDNRANMAYIARNTAANQYAISIRGTDFAIAIDRNEDFDVGTVVPFAQAGSPKPVLISKGAMEAFNEVTSAEYALDGTNILEAVSALANKTPGATVYVTGHSLGGAMATTVALYLANEAKQWSSPVTFNVYTFAAPTAGLDAFAGFYDQVFKTSSWRVFNLWDVVPNAWQTLSNVDNFYPHGPQATDYVLKEISRLQARTNGLQYTQPTVNPVPLNQDEMRDMNHVKDTTFDFLQQVAYQHQANTYLTLLKAPNVVVHK